MKESIRYEKEKTSNAVEMKIRFNDEMYDRHMVPAETGSRFVQSASLLEKKEFLGWQVEGKENKPLRTFAFTGDGAKAAREDLAWIFRGCAELQDEQDVSMEDPYESTRKVYVLLRAGENAWEEEADPEKRRRFFRELMVAVRAQDAVIRVLAGPAGADGQGSVRISLPEPMTLRMHTMLSLALPGCEVLEIGKAEGRTGLPSDILEEAMTGLLDALMNIPPREEAEKEDGLTEDEREKISLLDEIMKDFDIMDTDDCFGVEKDKNPKPERVEDSTELSGLDLTVRAMNWAKRVGFTTAGEVREAAKNGFCGLPRIGGSIIKEFQEKKILCQETEKVDYDAQLADLIGLREVKEQVRKIAAFARMQKDMAARGKKAVPLALNTEFTGNPGTAKTTVARILAGIFHEIGLLQSPEPVEVGRAGLVGKYVGHTAQKVQEVFESARGKLLFIDEAYALSEGGSEDYGREAITTIVQEMENHRDETIVIFAGYPDLMERFFDRNPGLRSRVPFSIRFADYTAEEMVQITGLEAEKRGFTISPEAKTRVEDLCAEIVRRGYTGNGRLCRNLVESAILEYAMRVYGNREESCEGDFELSAEDFHEPGNLKKALEKRPIGFGA